MKKALVCVILLFFLAGCTFGQPTNGFIDAEVIKVIDGDTIKVRVNGKEETVRLLLIDTPETVHPTKPVQPFGVEATNFTKEKLTGKDVQLEMDVGERDKYGRVLAYVYIDNTMVNEQLLEKGLARVAYVYEPNTKYVDKFYEIQKKAMEQEIGIWSIENYATEDGFVEEAVGAEKKAEVEKTNQVCKIKGNINSAGEKIYHTESSPSYKVTKPEEMFCSEKEAIAAGYRPVKNN